MPAVSCVIPILNGMPFLPDALASLENQTYRDFEVIVWDNGSTDGTLKVLRDWIPKRLPGRVVTGEPLSLGLSLRRLCEVAESQLIARMDADDICESNRFDTQVRFLTAHPEFALVASERTCIDEAGQPTPARSEYPHRPEDILHATLRAPRILHPTVMMRREALIEIGNYNDLSSETCPYWSEDYDLWMRFLAKHRAITLPEKLLKYRYNPHGLTENEMRLKRAATARRAAWQANAGDFAGITDHNLALQLWDRQMWCALPTLNAINRHFQRIDAIKTRERWMIPSFRNTASSFVARHDLITRLFIRCMKNRCR